MKKAAVFNDMSGFGKCSLTAAIPVFSVMGVQACPVPTAILSNQTGYPEYYCSDFTDSLPLYIGRWKKQNPHFDGILTGYMANEKQIEIIGDFCSYFKKDDTLLVVDPVMADNGRVYDTYSAELCRGVRELSLKADIITPNLTELCVLTNTDFDEVNALAYSEGITQRLKDMADEILAHGVKTVIVTSVPLYEGKISNCIFERDSQLVVSSKSYHGSFSGTGDLFASAVTAGVIKGRSVFDAVSAAARFIEAAVGASVCEMTRPEAGTCFEPFLKLL